MTGQAWSAGDVTIVASRPLDEAEQDDVSGHTLEVRWRVGDPLDGVGLVTTLDVDELPDEDTDEYRDLLEALADRATAASPRP